MPMEYVIAALAGVLIGVVLGSLGGGGGILTVPVLIYLMGMQPLQATTASLIIVGISSLAAALAHARASRVDWARGSLFAAFGTIGTVTGSLLSRDVDGEILMLAFGLLLLLVAALMFRKARRGGSSAAEVKSLRDPRTAITTVGTAILVGLLTGFFGVGGGFAIVPALTLVLGLPVLLAVGTSRVVIVINSATSLATRLAVGVELDWPVIAAFALAAMVGSLAGSRVTSRVSPRTLQLAFAALLVVVAIYTIATNAVALAS